MEKKKMSPKLRLALIILGVYLLVLIAAAVLIDGRTRRSRCWARAR